MKRFIINLLAPDYYYIKAENDQYRTDIYNLVRDSDGVDGLITKIKYDLMYRLDEALYGGQVIKYRK